MVYTTKRALQRAKGLVQYGGLTSGAAHSKVPSALTLVSPRVRMRAKPTSAIFATPSRLSNTALTSNSIHEAQGASAQRLVDPNLWADNCIHLFWTEQEKCASHVPKEKCDRELAMQPSQCHLHNLAGIDVTCLGHDMRPIG